MAPKYDFGGYATKANLKCSDGRVITPGAFKGDSGHRVPLVWQHIHDDPDNVLGHAILENRDDGVYAYGVFNDTPAGQRGKELVKHGDITALSIYANNLVQKGSEVLHGVIREVSLVMAGANPGAMIDNLSIQHGDSVESLNDEAVIYTGLELQHADSGDTQGENVVTDTSTESKTSESSSDSDKTVQDVFDSLTDEQKNVVYYMIGEALNGDDTAEHSDMEGNGMSRNVFEGDEDFESVPHLSHSQIETIFKDAQRHGSLKDSFLAHAGEYGIDNIDILFPDAKTLQGQPDLIKRRTEWVDSVLSGTRHSPFSRIKSIAATLTADEARAKGYIKGKLKKEEVFPLLKRVTTPTTVYKKQKLDRDDIIDITDLDVVAFLKAEMRVMLDEELARAILVGDGRAVDDDDHIKAPLNGVDGEGIRPIWTDSDLYAIHTTLEANVGYADMIDAVIRARKEYRGSGTPTLYLSTGLLVEFLLLKDTIGRRLYATQAELASAMGVSSIVEVPVMDGLSRTKGTDTVNLIGIVVNLADYTVGADKGGEISMFDDFDIDYNQYKYLLETRASGTLTHPYSALVIEQKATAAAGGGA